MIWIILGIGFFLILVGIVAGMSGYLDSGEL